MNAEQSARLAALVTAIDDTAAAHIADLDPVMAMGVSALVSEGRKDPEWLLDQTYRAMAVASAMIAYIDDGRLTAAAALPEIVREAIERAAQAVHVGTSTA